jgi:hypothetical protein
VYCEECDIARMVFPLMIKEQRVPLRSRSGRSRCSVGPKREAEARTIQV